MKLLNRKRVPGTRDQMNGTRMIPQGVKIEAGFKEFDVAWEAAKRLQRKAKHGETFNVSGVAGDYCLLMYGAKLVPDVAYLHTT